MSGLDPITSGIAGGKEILDAGITLVTLLRQLKGQLLGQPDPAARALATVLKEIDKTYTAVDAALNQYLGVLFNPNQQIYEVWNAEARKELLPLESDPLRARIAETRTHSHKIERIYDAYLRGWFQRVFGPTGKESEISNTFHTLWGTDSQIVLYMDKLAGWLSNEADGTLNLVDKGDLRAANLRIIETREKVKPFRKQLSKIMTELRVLEGDFDNAAGVLGL